MIKEVTRNVPSIQQEINREVGKAFTFLEKVKRGRIGSQRFDVKEYTILFSEYFDDVIATNRCNIELRPKGILVGFQKGYQSFVWVIPFVRLHIENEGLSLTIRDINESLVLHGSYNSPIEPNFIEKIQKQIA